VHALDDLLENARTPNLAPGLSPARPTARITGIHSQGKHGEGDVPRRWVRAESPKEGIVPAAAPSENRNDLSEKGKVSADNLEGAAL
jgi:hypothetical protein